MAKQKQAKQAATTGTTGTTANAATEAETFTYRHIVRGDLPSGKRVRRVRNHTGTLESAYGTLVEVADKVAADEGLANVYSAVYPPVGLLCRAGISRGFELKADGSIGRVEIEA